MRLKSREDWIDQWTMPQMYVGIPGQGATDAWYGTLTELEEMQLKHIPFAGGTADIMKFVDQIQRELVYRLAEQAGLPKRILLAYRNFLENLKLHNSIDGTIGHQFEEMWHPARVPFLYDHGRPYLEAMDHAYGGQGNTGKHTRG